MPSGRCFTTNHKVDAASRYTFDPLYRLIEATGRENIAQSAFQFAPHSGDYRDYPFAGATRLSDLEVVRNFTERFKYDPVGNFLQTVHQAENGSWTRHYSYDEDSLIESGKRRQSPEPDLFAPAVTQPFESYLYDVHGNIVQMPHLPVMQWDFMDRLAASARQVVNCGTPETTFYIYDGIGQRVRKVTERQTVRGKTNAFMSGGLSIPRI